MSMINQQKKKKNYIGTTQVGIHYAKMREFRSGLIADGVCKILHHLTVGSSW